MTKKIYIMCVAGAALSCKRQKRPRPGAALTAVAPQLLLDVRPRARAGAEGAQRALPQRQHGAVWPQLTCAAPPPPQVKEGVESVDGVEAKLFRVPETLSDEARVATRRAFRRQWRDMLLNRQRLRLRLLTDCAAYSGAGKDARAAQAGGRAGDQRGADDGG
jgi:hypothetical protein